MIKARFRVTEIGGAETTRDYSSLEALGEDFPLTSEEVTGLYEGEDVRKTWAKRRWTITLLSPKDK